MATRYPIVEVTRSHAHPRYRMVEVLLDFAGQADSSFNCC